MKTLDSQSVCACGQYYAGGQCASVDNVIVFCVHCRCFLNVSPQQYFGKTTQQGISNTQCKCPKFEKSSRPSTNSDHPVDEINNFIFGLKLLEDR